MINPFFQLIGFINKAWTQKMSDPALEGTKLQPIRLGVLYQESLVVAEILFHCLKHPDANSMIVTQHQKCINLPTWLKNAGSHLFNRHQKAQHTTERKTSCQSKPNLENCAAIGFQHNFCKKPMASLHRFLAFCKAFHVGDGSKGTRRRTPRSVWARCLKDWQHWQL